ncbi:MAG: ABC transporter ATP-binding protein [Candidatus Sericytochromatia bacterium]|nr:ABC transporter ATP-binding protein [Candidatus Sericytochromatia bacterium]
MHALSRSFAQRPALRDISLSVHTGEVFGVLGPNGAGKTTTVRLLNGILKPDSGEARVMGLDPATQGDAVRRLTGVLTETPSLYERLSAYDNLAFFGAMYGLPAADIPKRIDHVLRALDLRDRMHDAAGGFSKGMKQRLAIARAMLHNPPLLFLDEPTAGLDPGAAEEVNVLIADLKRQGHTVFLCTHRLVEAEKVCDRFALFAQGRVLAIGTKEALVRQIWPDHEVVLEFMGGVPAFPKVPGMIEFRVGGRTMVVSVAHERIIPQVVAAAVAAGGELLRVAPVEHSLEDVYFALLRHHTGALK